MERRKGKRKQAEHSHVQEQEVSNDLAYFDFDKFVKYQSRQTPGEIQEKTSTAGSEPKGNVNHPNQTNVLSEFVEPAQPLPLSPIITSQTHQPPQDNAMINAFDKQLEQFCYGIPVSHDAEQVGVTNESSSQAIAPSTPQFESYMLLSQPCATPQLVTEQQLQEARKSILNNNILEKEGIFGTQFSHGTAQTGGINQSSSAPIFLNPQGSEFQQDGQVVWPSNDPQSRNERFNPYVAARSQQPFDNPLHQLQMTPQNSLISKPGSQQSFVNPLHQLQMTLQNSLISKPGSQAAIDYSHFQVPTIPQNSLMSESLIPRGQQTFANAAIPMSPSPNPLGFGLNSSVDSQLTMLGTGGLNIGGTVSHQFQASSSNANRIGGNAQAWFRGARNSQQVNMNSLSQGRQQQTTTLRRPPGQIPNSHYDASSAYHVDPFLRIYMDRETGNRHFKW